MQFLVNWNRAMALLHTALFATTLATADMQLTLPLFHVGYDRAANVSNTSAAWIVPGEFVVDSNKLYISWVSAAFSLLSALFHVLNSDVWRAWYLSEIAVCRCRSRWYEYSLSAPLQIVAIAYFTGTMITDLLVAIFGLMSTTMFFGMLTEELARPAGPNAWTRPPLARLQAHFMGYIPYVFAFAIIIQAFVRASAFSTVDSDGVVRKMPEFVYYIVATQLGLFSSFSVVQLVVTLRPPSKYYQGEIAYMALSLAAKAVLSILLLGNVIAVSVFQAA